MVHPQRLRHESTSSFSCVGPKNLCASTGNEPVVSVSPTTIDTFVRAASPPHTVPKTALAHRQLHPISPYDPTVWESQLCAHNLLVRYPNLPNSLRFGFNLNFPHIVHTQIPPNSSSLLLFREAFETILAHELATGRYIGPFTYDELLSLLGPFQCSPISIIPKTGKPGRFRVIQNFSFPLVPSLAHPNLSINASVNSDAFPCTWGTFDTVWTIICSLPPGSQAATRDVAEAYRTVPLHHSQWPAAVIQLPGGDFCVDTCISFGMGPSAGVYGHVADAGLDLLRAAGLGPLTKWVDDHLFFRIRREYLTSYNTYRASTHSLLARLGPQKTGGRIWYKGEVFDNESFDVHAEDYHLPLQDLSSSSPRSIFDSNFCFSFADINRASSPFGYPWEPTKDTAFSFETLFLGFLWSIICLTVQLSTAKKEKYRAAITEWRSREMHVLRDVQRLYGKLLHTCLVVPAGRAYLTTLETMLGVCSSSPFVPHHPVRHLDEDLKWWSAKLSLSFVGRPITQPPPLLDIHAFSDASTSVGIAVVINGYWRAWTLRPNWQYLDGQRDIGWAECVGFELLVHAVLDSRKHDSPSHFRVFCDNQGVINGWKNGRSRNRATNLVFRRIHELLESQGHGTSFHLCYVPSSANPADGPSRGIFPPHHLLLPPIDLPGDLHKLIYEADLSAGTSPSSCQDHRSFVNEPTEPADIWDWGEQLLKFRDTWSD